MSEEKTYPLNTSEFKAVGKALFSLLSECPHLPDAPLKYQSIDEKVSVGLFTLPGAKYLRQEIDGSFVAQVRFQVAYKSFPTTNEQRSESQEVIDRIMAWLENTADLPLLTDGRRITEITASNSIPYKDATGEDTSITFAADAVMEYRKKGFM